MAVKIALCDEAGLLMRHDLDSVHVRLCAQHTLMGAGLIHACWTVARRSCQVPDRQFNVNIRMMLVSRSNTDDASSGP